MFMSHYHIIFTKNPLTSPFDELLMTNLFLPFSFLFFLNRMPVNFKQIYNFFKFCSLFFSLFLFSFLLPFFFSFNTNYFKWILTILQDHFITLICSTVFRFVSNGIIMIIRRYMCFTIGNRTQCV